jgi:competence protein ComEC
VSGSGKTLALTNYESRFDFNEYLNSLGVYSELSIKRNSLETLFATPFRLNSYSDYALRYFDSDSKALIRACLFNRKDYGNEVLGEANSLNLLYLLSSSGVVFGFICREVEKLIGWKCKRVDPVLAGALLTLVFTFLSPYKIGLWRLLFSKIFTFLNTKFKWCLKGYVRTSAIGILFLLLDRYLAYQSGFALGFMASLLFSFSKTIIEKVGVKYRFLPRFALFHLFLFPVEVSGSGGFHLLSPLFSYFLIPFALFFDFLGLFALAGISLHGLAKPLSKALLYLLKGLSKFDLAVPFASFSSFFPLLYYLLFFLCLLLYELGQRKRVGAIAFSLCLGIAISHIPIRNYLSQEVYFINVGQGDSILIRDGLNAVMIDTGGQKSFDIAKESLIPFLKKERIYKLDCLIASHDDFDHIGAKESLCSNFRVDSFASDPSSFPLKVGSLTFNNLNVYSWSDENDASLVLTLSFMGKEWVFMGDASVATEKRILEDNHSIPCDILKIGHHGSKTSSSAEWLDALKPSEAVISVGRKNSYQHPHKEVVERLEERGIKIRRTDEEGTVRYAKFAFRQV